MNIHTLRNNLKNTIAGKQEVYDLLQERKNIKRESIDQMVMLATLNFLEINLVELNKILVDVEACCEQAAEAGWAANPDRMGQ